MRPAIGSKLGVGSPSSGSKLPSLLIALKQENVCKADERRTHARRELLRVLGFLAVDNFDFTRKIVKKKIGVKNS